MRCRLKSQFSHFDGRRWIPASKSRKNGKKDEYSRWNAVPRKNGEEGETWNCCLWTPVPGEPNPGPWRWRSISFRYSGNPFPGLVGYANWVGRLPLAFEPGERWMYGFSIDILGAVIEVLSGKTLGEYLKEHIFDPLGMKDTGFFVPPEKQGRIARLYQINEGMKPSDRQYPARKPEFESGGGGLFSTVPDYSRFAQMLLHGGTLDGVRILGRKTVDLMSTDHLTAEQRKAEKERDEKIRAEFNAARKAAGRSAI